MSKDDKKSTMPADSDGDKPQISPINTNRGLEHLIEDLKNNNRNLPGSKGNPDSSKKDKN